MQTRQNSTHAKPSGVFARQIATAFALTLCLVSSGCLSSLQKHTAALSAATNPVIDEAATAYRTAQTIHDARLNYEAVEQFNASKTVSQSLIVSFPSDGAIQVRLTVLEAFKCYVQSLVEITNGVSSPQLDAASQSVGGSIANLGNTLAPTIMGALGQVPADGTTTITTISAGSTSTTTSDTVAPPAVSPATQNAISTAAMALGQFLVSRKIKSELPAKMAAMDPKLEALCNLMEQDIDLLQDHNKRDFTYMKEHQTLFIQDGKALDPQERRLQIIRLADMIRQQQNEVEQLTELRAAIVKLYLTHHALVADAQNNNPESLKAKIGDLAAAGNDLGKFYSSLPTQ
jgi:hypothetical protein